MVAVNNQRWLTCAADDKEAWKCLLLARSIRKSLTTRLIGVFISDQVSDGLSDKLKIEFDICTRIGQEHVEKYPSFAFSTVAILFAWSLPRVRKFIFLDCNNLMLKNSDELFRENGIRLSKCEGRVMAMIWNSNSVDGNKQDMIIHFETGNLLSATQVLSVVSQLGYKYTVALNWESELTFPINGKEWKIVHFPNYHPLDVGENWNGLGRVEKAILDICVMLLPENYGNGGIRGPKFVENVANLDLVDSIAIVGMACRFPGANSIDEFWGLLEAGHEGICRVPNGRWTKENSLVRVTDVKNTEAGFLACPIDKFDAKFFNTNSADMALLDPQQRLTLQIVWEGLEHAGIDPESLKNSLTGVFGGWWRQDYKEILQEIGTLNEAEFFRSYMGNTLGTLTARISHFFELTGPSIATESGCSTSIVGVDMACDSLKNENCDIALAVGANLLLHPFNVSIMNTVIAVNGRCKTFDAEADGFGRAEGVAALVLKRYPDAVSNGDRIWGVIRGSAVVQEGPSKSMGTPTVDCEALAMQLALDRAGVSPMEVSYVETHGTGTPVGDPLEIEAVAKIYSKGRKEVLTVGSVKTNIGHTESVSGIAGIIKTVLSLRHGKIPMHLNFNSLNPDINLSAIPAQLPLQLIGWKKRQDGKPRIAGVSSFGITGTDAHIVIQEPPEDVNSSLLSLSESRPMKIFTISAKSEDSLRVQMQTFRNFIQTTCLSLKDIEFTQNTGRAHFPFRKAIVASTNEMLLNETDKALHGPYTKIKPVVDGNTPKLCLLFTGQGSQYPGMAKSLYEGSIVFQTHFDQCESLLSSNYGFQIRDALWGEESDLLKRTLYSQVSIFCIEYCLLKLWESWGIKPDAVLGHSLGEFAAAVAAVVLSFEDALRLVVTRSKLVDSLPNSNMLVVGGCLSTVENLLKNVFEGGKMWLDVAAVNSDDQTVLAGPMECIQKFATCCENNNLKWLILDSSHAFHSRLMDPILEEYEITASSIVYNEPKNCKFISGVTGKMTTKIDANYWIKHTRDRVRFLEASTTALVDGNSVFLEIGPHPVLSAMIMVNSDSLDQPTTCHASLRKKHSDCETMLGSLGKLYTMGYPIDWRNFHRFSGGSKVDLPGYVFDEKQFWLSIQDDGTIPFHPLVGGYVPNPSSSKIFKNDLTINRVPFLKDHALRDKLIFPGAGYLEMCLCAGYAATCCPEGVYTKPSSGIGLRNFSIDAPLCLNEKSVTEFQVVVNNSGSESVGTVYTKLDTDTNNFKWIRHASATFHSSSISSQEMETPSLDSIKARCTEHFFTDDDYKSIEEHGYNFGPSFKTLKNGWTSKDDATPVFLFEFKSCESPEYYLLHPCIIDAMFQAQLLSMGLNHTKINTKTTAIPIQVESFTCWTPQYTKGGYIYVTPSKTSEEKDVQLFDNDGTLVATMIGTEYVETTINNIMALIESQRNPYPTMYEYVWRDGLGPFERRVATSGSVKLSDAEKFNTFTPQEELFYNSSNSLFGLYMIQALVNLEINEHFFIGSEIRWPDISEKLNVIPGLERFLRYILMEISEDGWMEVIYASVDEMCFKVLKLFPSSSVITAEIELLKNEIRSNKIGVEDANCVEPLGESLSDVLLGKQSSLSILFPDGNLSSGPAEQYYQSSFFASKSGLLTEDSMPKYMDKLIPNSSSQAPSSKPVVRILEVGAGTGSATKLLIKSLTGDANFKCEYTYTDISSIFLSKKESIFENTGIYTKFKCLNIEQDPMDQGFIPGYYDTIFAAYVIHATHDIKETVHNLKKLLKPSGNIIILELTNPNRAINLLFGGLAQFWKFTDVDLRPFNCELSVPNWEKTLMECGFVDFCSMRTFNSKNAAMIATLPLFSEDPRNVTLPLPTWVVFGNNDSDSDEIVRNLDKSGRRVVVIIRSQFAVDRLEEEILNSLNAAFGGNCHAEGIAYLWGLNSSLSYQDICQPYLYICKFLALSIANVRVVTFTRGNLKVGPSDFVFNRPDSTPIFAMTSATVNEIPGLIAKCVDLDPSSTSDPVNILEAFTELFTTDTESIVAYRKNHRYLPRLHPYKTRNTGLAIPSASRYQMILPSSNCIPDLRFVPMPTKSLGEYDVEVEVKAYGLNFRDLMVIIKPDPVFESFTTVGIDFAGVVTEVGESETILKVGDRVLGARPAGHDDSAMPSHVVLKGKLLNRIPDGMTFADSATIPVAFLTISLCLLNAAKIKEGDTVLIHTASGGVGLAAVAIAQYKKCSIVATAGSERKRAYLRNLGVQHVYNSRNTDYEHEIQNALGGRRVDVVLNSLTGVGFKEATLAVCAPGARFIEMSKMNIWSKQEVQALRSDVMYETVDLSQMSEDELYSLFLPVKELLYSSGNLRPFPYTRFDLTDVREAFEYMQEAKHIGKIVLIMPEAELKNSTMLKRKINLFNDNATYMITGGLGGIGLEVAKWMSCNGSKHLVLVGRTTSTEGVEEKLQEIRSRGVHVVVRRCDIGNIEECRALIDGIREGGDDFPLPPLRGIMHVAGELADATLEGQTWEKFETTFNGKVRGSWNLHQLTNDLEYPLEHFVMFSSMAAIFGSIGQISHAAANYFLDSFTHFRNSMGLPATTINWGQWGQVGVAANLIIPGVQPFTAVQGLAALENILRSNKSQVMVVEGDVGMTRKAFPSAKQLLSELGDKTASLSIGYDGDEFWKEYDSVETYDEKYDVVRKYIRTLLRMTLKLDKSDEINDNATFQDMGMDSLMMVEMKNELQTFVGKRARLSIASVRDCKTVVQLSHRLVELISGKQEIRPPTREELKELIIEDSKLPDCIQAKESITAMKKLGDISIVLVTGSTGTLGPYIVCEILKQPSIQKVYCLMRENKIFSSRDNFVRVVKQKNLLKFIDLDKIEFVVGDVSQPKLGMHEDHFKHLVAEADAVFHLAVCSNWEACYLRTTDTRHPRVANVAGMVQILSFAVESRLKYVFHASAVVAETGRVEPDGRFWEDWPIEGEFDNRPNTAYPISKYICDRLVAQAVERGVPCKAFRFPNIGGDSVNGGNFQIMDSFMMMRLMAYMHMGFIPAHSMPLSILPVDMCAAFSIQLFFNQDTRFEMFNVVNPYIFDEREFDDMAKEFGVKVQVVEPDEFLERIKKLDVNDDANQIVRMILTREHEREGLEENIPDAVLKWIQGDKEVFLSKKLCRFLRNQYPTNVKSTTDILRRDLQFAKDNGFFDKFGIKYLGST